MLTACSGRMLELCKITPIKRGLARRPKKDSMLISRASSIWKLLKKSNKTGSNVSTKPSKMKRQKIRYLNILRKSIEQNSQIIIYKTKKGKCFTTLEQLLRTKSTKATKGPMNLITSNYVLQIREGF